MVKQTDFAVHGQTDIKTHKSLFGV